jgi:hypothetical protein
MSHSIIADACMTATIYLRRLLAPKKSGGDSMFRSWPLQCAKFRQADKAEQINREIFRIFICAIIATSCLQSTCDNRYLQ